MSNGLAVEWPTGTNLIPVSGEATVVDSERSCILYEKPKIETLGRAVHLASFVLQLDK